MKTSFLDYYKLILDKVSFDRELFEKEYRKALKTLKAGEAEELNTWLHKKGLYSKLRVVQVTQDQRIGNFSKAF